MYKSMIRMSGQLHLGKENLLINFFLFVPRSDHGNHRNKLELDHSHVPCVCFKDANNTLS